MVGTLYSILRYVRLPLLPPPASDSNIKLLLLHTTIASKRNCRTNRGSKFQKGVDVQSLLGREEEEKCFHGSSSGEDAKRSWRSTCTMRNRFSRRHNRGATVNSPFTQLHYVVTQKKFQASNINSLTKLLYPKDKLRNIAGAFTWDAPFCM